MRAANKLYRRHLSRLTPAHTNAQPREPVARQAAGHGTFLGRFLISSAHDRCGALCTKLEMDVL